MFAYPMMIFILAGLGLGEAAKMMAQRPLDYLYGKQNEGQLQKSFPLIFSNVIVLYTNLNPEQTCDKIKKDE